MRGKFLLIAGHPESLINFRGPLIQAISDTGLKVHVASPDLPVDSALRQKLLAFGVQVHEINLKRTGTNPLIDVITFWQLWWLIGRIKPDVILGYTIKPVVYGNLAAWIRGVPKRFTLITGLGYAFQETSGKRQWLKNIAKHLYRLSLSKANIVFFQNPDDEALFLELDIVKRSKKTVVVNGSGVDVDKFAVVPFPKHMQFLLIARLLGDKGIREYVSAASKVRQRFPDVRFALAGWIDDNPDAISKDELDSWVESGDILFYGRLEDVRPAIAESSVYVLPSYREGTPRTVLEAMAMGRPIITTDAPGCRETVIDGDNGFLIPIKQTDDLVSAILRFIERPELISRMGGRSRQIAQDKYDVRKVNQHMLWEMGLNGEASY